MGSLYQRKQRSGTVGKVWWCKYYINGRPIRESTGTVTGYTTRSFFDRYHIIGSPAELQEASKQLTGTTLGHYPLLHLTLLQFLCNFPFRNPNLPQMRP